MIFKIAKNKPVFSGVSRSTLREVSWLELVNNPFTLIGERLLLDSGLDLSLDALHLRQLPIGAEPQEGNIWYDNQQLLFRNATTTFRLDLNAGAGLYADISGNPWLLGATTITLDPARRLLVKSITIGSASEITGQLHFQDGPKPDTGTLLVNNMYASGGDLWWWNGVEEVQLNSVAGATAWADITGNPFSFSGPALQVANFPLLFPQSITVGPAIDTWGAIRILRGPKPNTTGLNQDVMYANEGGLFWWDGIAERRLDSSSVAWADLTGNPFSFSGPALTTTFPFVATAGLTGNKLRLTSNNLASPAAGDVWFFGSDMFARASGATTKNITSPLWESISNNPFSFIPVGAYTWILAAPDHFVVAEILMGGAGDATKPGLILANTDPEGTAGVLPGYVWFNGVDFKVRTGTDTVNLTDVLTKITASGASLIALNNAVTFQIGGTAGVSYLAPFRFLTTPDASGVSTGNLWLSQEEGYLKFRNLDTSVVPVSFPYGESASASFNSYSIVAPTLGAWYTVDLAAEEFTTGLMAVDAVTDNFITVFRDAVYRVELWLEYDMAGGTSVAEDCFVGVAVNEVTAPPQRVFKSNVSGILTASFLLPLLAGDTVEAVIRDQGAGGGDIVLSGGTLQVSVCGPHP